MPGGAGVMIYGQSGNSTGKIVNSTVSGNHGDSAVGLRIDNAGHFTVINSTITDNGTGGGWRWRRAHADGLELRYLKEHDSGR